ncbi:MAG: helix-turn-helix transcriptional regulator [Alteromonadaceae bacterium]|nr:helix-turn-helix transcriptional regulator [Alteromonadaceae bacterium]
MNFGEQFKKLRNELGLSQPQLSELTGIEQSYLSKLENDKSVPSNEIFRSLLSAYKIDLNQFLSDFDLKRDRELLSQIPDVH